MFVFLFLFGKYSETPKIFVALPIFSYDCFFTLETKEIVDAQDLIMGSRLEAVGGCYELHLWELKIYQHLMTLEVLQIHLLCSHVLDNREEVL